MNQTDCNAAADRMASRPSQSMRVLIVEDDRASRITLRKMLKSLGGVEVVEAADGQEAWEMLQRGVAPALCFVDINMPRMSGLELLQRVRDDKRLAGLKVCFCSAVRDRQVIIQAAAFQPDYYILKPYSLEVIRARVQNARADADPVLSLETVDEACERLGIDRAAYLGLHEKFREELSQLATRVPTLLTRLDIPGAINALVGAGGTAKRLGAQRAANLIEHLLRLIKSSNAVRGDGPVSREEMAADLTKWLARSTDQLFQITHEIRLEAENLGHLTERVAKTGPARKASEEAPDAEGEAGLG